MDGRGLAPECEVCVCPKLEVGKTVPQELKEPRTKEPPALGMLGYLDFCEQLDD